MREKLYEEFRKSREFIFFFFLKIEWIIRTVSVDSHCKCVAAKIGHYFFTAPPWLLSVFRFILDCQNHLSIYVIDEHEKIHLKRLISLSTPTYYVFYVFYYIWLFSCWTFGYLFS